MNRVQTVIDGVIVYDSGAVVTPPPVDPVDPPPVEPPPTVPPGPYTPFELKLSGADILRLPSGQVASAVLPNVRAAGGTTNSGRILFGESTVSPRGATIEITISKTPGLIDPLAGDFYLRSTNTAYVEMIWLERMPPGWSANIPAMYHIPMAFADQGPWYVNVRYTYTDCSYNPCGFVNQWNFGGF